MNSDEAYDWADDDSLSAEETMRIFESLNPEPTVGPDRPNKQLPTPAELMPPPAETFATAAETVVEVFRHVGIATTRPLSPLTA